MEPADLEEALRVFLSAHLEDAEETTEVRASHSVEELDPFRTSVVIAVDQMEHEVGPLYSATVVVLITTPAIAKPEETPLDVHRRITALVSDAWDGTHDADICAATEDEGAGMNGYWKAETTNYQENGRWNAAFQITMGLELIP